MNEEQEEHGDCFSILRKRKRDAVAEDEGYSSVPSSSAAASSKLKMDELQLQMGLLKDQLRKVHGPLFICSMDKKYAQMEGQFWQLRFQRLYLLPSLCLLRLRVLMEK